MNNLFILLSSLLILSSEFCLAQEFRSYQELRATPGQVLPAFDNKSDPSNQDNPVWAKGTANDDLIRQMDYAWKKPKLKEKFDMIRPYETAVYSEGTGSRGGGSGVLVPASASVTEVKLLDVFRSENLQLYSNFFPIDAELRKFEDSHTAEEATKLIFEEVLGRISKVAPNLGAKIQKLYKEELPFQNWIPIFSDLPLIEDEVKHPLEKNQNKVQVAFRRLRNILYNPRAYAAMRPVSRAALRLHEYVYALSGSEDSVRTQRTVSLFFSSDFLKIADDTMKLTLLFNELELLAISRKSIAGSLPPGAYLTIQKLTENCGMSTAIEATPTSPSVVLTAAVNGRTHTVTLSRSEAMIVLSSIAWSKSFLGKRFPLFRYPGQRTMPDILCFNSTFTKIIQTQSSLALDEEVRKATEAAATAEVIYYMALGKLAEAEADPKQTNQIRIHQLQNNALEAQHSYLSKELDLKTKSITSLEKVLFPQLLGEYVIDISY